MVHLISLIGKSMLRSVLCKTITVPCTAHLSLVDNDNASIPADAISTTKIGNDLRSHIINLSIQDLVYFTRNAK